MNSPASGYMMHVYHEFVTCPAEGALFQGDRATRKGVGLGNCAPTQRLICPAASNRRWLEAVSACPFLETSGGDAEDRSNLG
jgi:hypothetical protein